MTTDEALELVRQTDRCWIVFNSETGEALAVVADRADQSAEERFAHLANLSQYNQPVKTRAFKSAAVTREVLDGERGEAARVTTRVRILTQWSRAAAEELLQVLERGRYDYPMNKDFDSRVIVDSLWELHRAELEAVPRERLAALLSGGALCAAAGNKLRIYLAALEGDERRLKAIWMREEPGRECFSDVEALMDAFAHIRTTDQEIIGEMIRFLESGLPFECAFDTMMALGKVGPASGQRAADVIRARVHDDQPWVVAARDRVLQRLESKDDWSVCGACCNGRVRDAGGHGVQSCPICLGLGYRSAN